MTQSPQSPPQSSPQRLPPNPPLADADWNELRRYRLDRVRAQMAAEGVALCVLNNPINLRYAADFCEYSLFQSHIPTCYLFVPLSGPLVMHGALRRDLSTIDQHRPSDFLTAFDGGLDLRANSRRFAANVIAFLREHDLHEPGAKVALERCAPVALQAVADAGLRADDAERILEHARAIKSPLELRCMRHSIAVAEHGIERMLARLEPGISENELWSVLHQVNIAHGGQWIDGRVLSSGARTNPGMQEATDKVIEAGELVCFDTDLIGPAGYCADISRSVLCRPATPSAQQRHAYQHAYEEVHRNLELLRPGITFAEISARAFEREAEFVARRYPCVMHGVGLCDEYPKIYYREDWARDGYDGVVEENMVLCVESFSGSERGGEGVKLEQMARITADGCEVLSRYPFESDLL
ncbi:MAG: M24 family metallopeptidase [bacterium]